MNTYLFKAAMLLMAALGAGAQPVAPAGLAVLDERARDVGGVGFKWTANTETNLAGYYIYQGVHSGAYSNWVTIGLTNRGRVEGLSRTNRNYFVLSAFDAAGLESGYSGELVWPEPPAPPMALGTNYVVTVRYWRAARLEGAREDIFVISNYFTMTNAMGFYGATVGIGRME